MPKDETAFIGRVTAGVAQEIEILFAAVRNAAKLAEEMASQELPAEYVNLLSDMTNRCERGEQSARALKKFAQNVEHRPDRVHINAIVEQVGLLCAPWARRSGVTLKCYPCSSAVMTVNDPLLLQMGIFAVIDIFLAVAPLVKEISLRCGHHDSGIRIDFEWNTADHPGEDEGTVEVGAGAKWERLHERVADLGALMELHETERRLRIVLPAALEEPNQQ